MGSVQDFPAFSAWGTAALSATSGASGGVMYRAWQWGDPAGLSQGQPRPGRRLRAPISELLVWSAVAGGPGGPNLLFALLTLCLRPPVSPSPARRDAAGELDRHTERAAFDTGPSTNATLGELPCFLPLPAWGLQREGFSLVCFLFFSFFVFLLLSSILS